MARKQVERDLPELEELFKGFEGFLDEENKTAKLYAELEAGIRRLRCRQPMPFYSMRMIGRFFNTGLRTVAKVYEQLEANGHLVISRGSRTEIRPIQDRPRGNLRGVVGIPVLLPTFVIGSAARYFYIRLEDELRKKHFVADFIFYRAEDETRAELAERLLRHNLDICFWLGPPVTARHAMLCLLDAGVRVAVVNDKGPFPVRQYDYNIPAGMVEIAKNWRKRGIEKVLFLRDKDLPTDAHHDVHRPAIEMVFRDAGIQPQSLLVESSRFPVMAREMARRTDTTGIVMFNHGWYEHLCQRFPKAMEWFFRRCRVLLTQGPVYHPAFTGKTVEVDSVDFDFENIACTVARHIASGEVWREGFHLEFSTKPLLRVNLGKVTRQI